ncbi:MAG: hypothetical protein PS018_06730 [bacterium]|nr:hypothetical protein [bacterium]
MQQPEPVAILPLFSIVIPLEYHRGQWERSWLGWQSQTIDKAAYEIVLVIPPDFPERDELHRLATSTTRLEFAEDSHDIGLCAIGAARARGQYLFFTESHCWPEPDVLELCRQAFRDHPDWAGFSCRSVRICHNKLSEAEADMYQSDIEFGMEEHPWRKVLDQCFVTRREAYEECGGLRPEFGHFAEWVLAADYYARGYKIGYLNEAQFHHYYVGALGELKAFTLDFVQGEIRYFSLGACRPGSELLEVPVEWSCRDNLDAAMARDIVRTIAANFLADVRLRQLRRGMAAIWRWLPPAIFGDGLARGGSAITAIYARLVLIVVALAGSRESVARAMKTYIAALIRYQRLSSIRAARAGTAGYAATRSGGLISTPSGFYPPERWNDRHFRWSETEAAVRIEGRPGRNTVRIECIDVREPLNRIDLRLFLDGRAIANETIAYGADKIEFPVDLPPSGIGTLAWMCRPFRAVADRRRLGLPVARIEVNT